MENRKEITKWYTLIFIMYIKTIETNKINTIVWKHLINDNMAKTTVTVDFILKSSAFKITAKMKAGMLVWG